VITSLLAACTLEGSMVLDAARVAPEEAHCLNDIYAFLSVRVRHQTGKGLLGQGLLALQSPASATALAVG